VAAGYLWVSNSSPMVALPQNMVTEPPITCYWPVPFFVFAGLIMERAASALRLVPSSKGWSGHLRRRALAGRRVSMYLFPAFRARRLRT